jgi:hypothetical protein
MCFNQALKFHRRTDTIKPILILILCFLTATAQAPVVEKAAWLARQAAGLRTKDLRNADFSDLQPLKKSIGDARIVLIGELNWWRDARNRAERSLPDRQLQLKARLVRFLHEEMGFDVLATRVSVFEGEAFDRVLDGRAPNKRSLRTANAHPDGNSVDGRSRPSYVPGGRLPAEVLDYARQTRKTPRPLHIAGFGTRISARMQLEYAKRLFQFIDGLDPALASPARRKEINDLLEARLLPPGWTNVDVESGLAAIASVRNGLRGAPAAKAASRDLALYLRTIEDLVMWESNGRWGRTLTGRVVRFGEPTPPVPLTRTRAADNLAWLAKQWHSGRKIIVWSDNSEILKNAQAPNIANRSVSVSAIFGQRTWEEFGPASYSIALTASRGDYGIPETLHAGQQPRLIPAFETIEYLLREAGFTTAFLDLRGAPPDHWLREPIAARAFEPPVVDRWPLLYDAFLFIDPKPAKPK